MTQLAVETRPDGPAQTERPTIWGLTPVEVHDRFWAARGVQVIRVGQEVELAKDAELFLLTSPNLLAIFRLRELVDRLSWVDPDVMWVRLHHDRERGYREQAITDENGEFVGFRRYYGGSDSRLARVALTPRRDIARLWQEAPSAKAGWQRLRQNVRRSRRCPGAVNARTYDSTSDPEVMDFLRDLVQTWKNPSATIARARKLQGHVWGDELAEAASGVRFIGPSWLGAGRTLQADQTVVGPAVLWDDPEARPRVEAVEWEQLEPGDTFGVAIHKPRTASWHGAIKRLFDLAVATILVVLLLPFVPVIVAAILIDDGWPIFFSHRRESRGGRQFGCLKFRSMAKEADRVKLDLARENQVDGPQFYIADDPRVTRVGRFLRRYHIDELPQLLNVLAGTMSLVGPRPSPYEENQCCPAWREARLSVLPGITGLWQVKRTREAGKDFQEWIRYDIEYVENASFWLDLWILWRTARQLLQSR
jgi:lipopolysaccharide/colanic/teichoic acid biosynthesis glycosyltransferase